MSGTDEENGYNNVKYGGFVSLEGVNKLGISSDGNCCGR